MEILNASLPPAGQRVATLLLLQKRKRMIYGRMFILVAGLVLALPSLVTFPGGIGSAAAQTVAGKPGKAGPVDINSATEAELAAVPQIGSVRAKAIIAGRPYRGKDELVSNKIISQGVYEKIRDRIIAKQ